jgi:hypothetical protein
MTGPPDLELMCLRVQCHDFDRTVPRLFVLDQGKNAFITESQLGSIDGAFVCASLRTRCSSVSALVAIGGQAVLVKKHKPAPDKLPHCITVDKTIAPQLHKMLDPRARAEINRE